MPWFPEFVSAVALARVESRATGQADPVGQYFAALNQGDTHVLEDLWPGEVVIFDPRAGEIRGHRQLREFVRHNESWMAGRHVRTEVVASTRVGTRAVVELLAHLETDGQDLAWPVAVVAESPDDREVVFRTYCTQWPVDGRRHVRPSILDAGSAAPGDIVSRYHVALAAGDADAIVSTFAPDGYVREFVGPGSAHRGTAELHAYFTRCFSGGGVRVQPCVVTDDGERCVLEYNCVRWGSRELSPQAGLGVYERGPDGLLAAARIYDDVERPGEQS